MNFMIIKLSAECLAAVGAKTADEFPAKLAALLNTCAGLSATVDGTKTALATAVETIGALETKQAESDKTISAQAEKIKTLEAAVGNPATMTEAKIKEIAADSAKIEASKVAVEQIGSIGGAPATAAPVNIGAAKTEAESFPDLVASAVAAGKTKTDAVLSAIKTNPEAHAEWLKAGGKL